MDATERFRQLVAGPERSLRLDEAAFLIAAHARPDLDTSAGLAALDSLAGQVRERTVDGVIDLLFGELGFTGNSASYYEPENSFLDQVLERRVGIPITLSLLAIEVARRVDVGLDGVGFPGHFLLRTRDDPPGFVDAFSGGRRLDVDGCAQLFRRLAGPEAPFAVEVLDPIGPRLILARMLGNLRTIYRERAQRQDLVWVEQLRVALPGAALADRRALAMALADVGRFDEAADQLAALADDAGARPGAAIRRQADQIRSRLN
jgi:regulator of sirC expression with transglutaminase-like and TPR domain